MAATRRLTLDLASRAPRPGFEAMATAAEDMFLDPARVLRIDVLSGSSGAVDALT